MECPECGSDDVSDTEYFHACFNCGNRFGGAEWIGSEPVATDTLYVGNGDWQLLVEMLSPDTSIMTDRMEVEVGDEKLTLTADGGSIKVVKQEHP